MRLTHTQNSIIKKTINVDKQSLVEVDMGVVRLEKFNTKQTNKGGEPRITERNLKILIKRALNEKKERLNDFSDDIGDGELEELRWPCWITPNTDWCIYKKRKKDRGDW